MVWGNSLYHIRLGDQNCRFHHNFRAIPEGSLTAVREDGSQRTTETPELTWALWISGVVGAKGHRKSMGWGVLGSPYPRARLIYLLPHRVCFGPEMGLHAKVG